MLPVGTLLQGGKYRIDRHLSSGGFGNTYVATNMKFEEQVAIKEFFMRGISQRDGDSVSVSVSNETNVTQFVSQMEKFRKEARRLRRLRNEHIVAVHDLFDENGTAYYEMDLIKGESLSERLRRTGQPFEESEVMIILEQVLDALAVVHAQGLYHLDLKPANIMIDQNGRALLIDFGASKQLSAGEGYSVSTSSALAYTPGYAPLEQIDQNIKCFGPWTDIYAFGATLYKLLTNLTPPSPSELISSRSTLNFPKPVSSRMQQLIIWMMKPAYEERPQSVADVKNFLEVKPEDEETEMVVEPKQETKPQPVVELKHEELPEKKSSTLWWGIGAGIVAAVVTVFVVSLILSKAPITSSSTENSEIELRADETISINGVSFKMIRVEGGTFTMGATPEQGSDALDVEKPAHQVTLSSYSIGETEVTQELWQAVMGSNPSCFIGPNRPVETVSWDDCQQFVTKLNQQTGRNFRLPTEAEWEYAARGGKKSKGYKYSGGDSLGNVAWSDNNADGGTHNVATKRANELGLYDMAGNVWEWCQDWYGEYSSSSQNNPTGPSSGSNRVSRGGSWRYSAKYCRVSNRSRNTPSFSNADIGLRLAL